jgi:hypothetical protein
MSSLFRRKLDELEDMFITSQDDLLARFSATYEENNRLKEEVERLTKELEHERSSVRFVSIGEVQEAVDKMPGACKHTEHPLMPCLDCIGAMMRCDAAKDGKPQP